MSPTRTEKFQQALARRQPDLTIVLENVIDPHNVSAVMRTCDAVGIQDVYVIHSRPVRPKKWGFKSSSSAAKWLTVLDFDSVDQCFQVLRKKYERILCARLDQHAADLYSTDLTRSTAIVFGNEQEGVSEDVRNRSDGSLLIPQVGIISSLNISVACAVTLYEAYRQKQLKGHYDRNNLDPATAQTLFDQWSLHKKLQPFNAENDD